MALSVQAALITKKGPEHAFNTDSVNAVGKVWPSDIIHGEKGLRVVGACADKPYYVLASADSKGTAQSAADLFDNCAAKFAEDEDVYPVLIADYMKAFSRVLVESGYSSSDCAFTIFAGLNDAVFAAKSADSRLYTFYDGTFTEILPQMTPFADNCSDYGVARCNNVKAGDIFIMLTGIVASVLPSGLLEMICRKSEGDVRKIASLIGTQAVKFGCKDAVSAIVIKITEAGAPAAVPAAVPAENAEQQQEAAQPEEAAAPAEEAPEADEAAQISAAIAAAVAEKDAEQNAQGKAPNAEENEEDAVPVKKGRRAVLLMLTFILAVALLAGLFFGVKWLAEQHFTQQAGALETESASESETASKTETASESESVTEKETTTEVPETEQPTTEETTTQAPATERRYTPAATTTTRAPETTRAPSTTRAPETTKAPAATERRTTEASETTTEETTEPTTEATAEETTEETAEETTEETTESVADDTAEAAGEADAAADEEEANANESEEPAGDTTEEQAEESTKKNRKLNSADQSAESEAEASAEDKAAADAATPENGNTEESASTTGRNGGKRG